MKEPLIRVTSTSSPAERTPGVWDMSISLRIATENYNTLITIASWIDTLCSMVAR